MSSELKFLIELVKGASLLIDDEFEVKAKDDNGDLVTNFDYEIEKYIIDKIKEKYPNFSIVSEEYNNKEGLADNCFTIDPIDGTINFAHNIPLWGIQVACIKNKKTCAAVIYLPKLDELYYADENGAFLNEKSISQIVSSGEFISKQKAKIEKTAQAILNARALYSDSSLADLYDPLTMPKELLKAHQDNDRAVMEAYGLPIKGTTESDAVAHLFKMYQRLTSK